MTSRPATNAPLGEPGLRGGSQRVRAAQIQRMYSPARFSLVGGLAGAVLLTVALWGTLPDFHLLGWLVRLKQILFNLLFNATKFTPDRGRIEVVAKKIERELFVSVADTGIGLRPEDRERIFQAFEQVDSSYAREQEGTDLGLALTRRLVELHGGRIWAESDGQGKGARFLSRFP